VWIIYLFCIWHTTHLLIDLVIKYKMLVKYNKLDRDALNYDKWVRNYNSKQVLDKFKLRITIT